MGFVDNWLYGFLWSKQREIAESVQKNRLTAVPSCHGTGKALGMDEPVLTPAGWRPIGTLEVGDLVVARDGSPTKVIGVYPQGIRPLYRVTMSDGSWVTADAEHLWVTHTRADKRAGRPEGVRTTREIAESLTFPNGVVRGLNHEVPVCEAVQHPEADLPIEPYLLGQWLGDGSKQGGLCGPVEQWEQLVLAGHKCGKMTFRNGAITSSVKGLRVALRELGMFGVGSPDRYIPPVYLTASIDQRIALLQGLLDTDGTVGRDNHSITFDTSSARLADDVAELCRSLGAVVRRSGRWPKIKDVVHRYSYRLYPSFPEGFKPFRVERKLARCGRNGGPNSARWQKRFIQSVEPVGEGDAICIRVDHPSETFLTRDHIVTHNSVSAAMIACWWIACHEPGEAFAVTLAPTAAQVDAILWREMNRIHSQGRLPGRMTTRMWRLDDGELVAFGRSPADTDPTAVQGIHAKYVIVIVDEACGVAKPIWDAASSMAANDFSRMLVIGNPDDPSTEFEAVCRPGSGWNVIPISAFDSPNFTNEPVPEFLRPLLVGPTWVDERKRRWGEDSPLYRSKVLGQFPSEAADGLVPLSAISMAVTRTLPPGPENELGVDIARYGQDATVIYHRLGPVARRYKKFGKRDTMFTAGQIIAAIRETGATVVRLDDTGVGGGVTDRLEELQRGADRSEGGLAARDLLRNVDIVPVNVGERPTVTMPPGAKEPEKRFSETERYVRLKDQLNWGLRERFIAGDIDLVSPEEDREQSEDIQAQAGDIKYALTSTGQIQIESKDDIKKRGRPSPDDWDALVLVFATATRKKRLVVSSDILARSRMPGPGRRR